MHQDTDVVQAFGRCLTPAANAALIARFLRVPPIWQVLHTPDVLARILATESLEGMRPADVLLASTSPRPVAADLMQSLLDDEPGVLSDFGPLDQLSLLARAVLWSVQNKRPVPWPERLQDASWAAALACAWPDLPADHAFLSQALTGDDVPFCSAVANALLANETLDTAARAILSNLGHEAARGLPLLHQAGEIELASAVASCLPAGESGAKDFRAAMGSAAEAQGRGELDGGQRALQQAWDMAQELSAGVADRLADLAEGRNEVVLALEARRRALACLASPRRRAALAWIQLTLGRHEEALRTLPAAPTCLEERIARALTLLQQANRSPAFTLMAEQSVDAQDLRQLPWVWLGRAQTVADLLGLLHLSGEITGEMARRAPSSPEAWSKRAAALAASGQHDEAVQAASLALALSPNLEAAQHVLAGSLMATGQAQQALPIWESLSTLHPRFLPNLAECALEAGDSERARQLAIRLLADDDQPVLAQILHARATAATGDLEGARRQLQALVSQEPGSGPAWIALAQVQGLEGDTALAGASLASAIQAVPGNPDILMAYARWLHNQGRTTEATVHANQGIALDPTRGEWLCDAGAWLRELGRPEEARPLLERAAMMRPMDATVRGTLAELCEHAGDVAEAYRQLKDLPLESPGIDHLLAGRLGVRYAEESHDANAIEWAARHLKSPFEPSTGSQEREYWYARALMLQANAIGAAQHLLAFLARHTDPASPDRLRAALALADAAIEAGQPPLALEPLEVLRPVFPNSVELHVQLARLYEACGMLDKALPMAELAADLAPTDPESFKRLGALAAAAGDPHTAMAANKHWVSIDPDNSEGWLAIADAASRLSRVDLQRWALGHALAIERNNPDRLLQLAGVVAAANEPRLAKLALRRAHRLAPGALAPLLALAEIAGLTDDPGQARQAWLALSQVAPDNPEYLRQAAQSEQDAGNLSASTDLFQRAAEVAPGDPRHRLGLAGALAAAGKTEAAIDAYRSALGDFPDDPSVLVAAGLSLRSFGQITEGLPLLEKAVRAAPNDAQARAALADSWLSAGEPAKALAVLDASPAEGILDIAHASMRALAYARLGDSVHALHALAQATLPQDPGERDRWWISRAARELGHWHLVLRPDLLPASSSHETRLEALRGMVRLADAAWLYTLLGASRHAPSARWVDLEAWGQWAQVEESLAGSTALKNPLAALRRRADVYRAANDEDTRSALSDVIAADPDGQTSVTLAIACLRAGLPAQAMAALRKSPARGGGWPDLLQGMAHAAQGAPALALDCFHSASSTPALRPVVAVLRARTYLSLGQDDQAVAEFNQAIATWPDEAAWRYELGVAYVDTQDKERALPHLQQAVSLAPDVHEYRLAYARLLAEAGHSAESVKEYEPVLESIPKVGGVWREAGAAALAAEDYPRAAVWFAQACTLLPDDPAGWVGAARAALAQEDGKQALDLIQAAARLSADDPQVSLTQGEVYAHQGKYDKALQAFDRAVAGLRDPLPAHLGRAGVMSRIGRGAEAAAELEALQKDAPEDERLWLALSAACETSGDIPAAIAAAEQALDLAPRAQPARVALGRLARRAGQLDRAIDVLTASGSTGPASAEAAIELGLAFEERRDLARALRQFQRAIEIDPRCARAHFRAGAVFRSIKDYPQASRMFERAVELDPKDADALHQLAAVRTLELVHGAIPLQAVL